MQLKNFYSSKNNLPKGKPKRIVNKVIKIGLKVAFLNKADSHWIISTVRKAITRTTQLPIGKKIVVVVLVRVACPPLTNKLVDGSRCRLLEGESKRRKSERSVGASRGKHMSTGVAVRMKMMIWKPILMRSSRKNLYLARLRIRRMRRSASSSESRNVGANGES